MEEKQATKDLAIKHYPGKWKAAQEHAPRDPRYVRGELDYWQTVRVYYLELGGEFIGQLSPDQRIKYWNDCQSVM